MQLIGSTQNLPEGHKQEYLFCEVLKLQRAFTALENCKNQSLLQSMEDVLVVGWI